MINDEDRLNAVVQQSTVLFAESCLKFVRFGELICGDASAPLVHCFFHCIHFLQCCFFFFFSKLQKYVHKTTHTVFKCMFHLAGHIVNFCPLSRAEY